MKIYQVEIQEMLIMTIEIEVENAQRAEAIIRDAYIFMLYFSFI